MAGGKGDEYFIVTIEILDMTTRHWSTAKNLPQPMFFGLSLRITCDQIYMLGGMIKKITPSNQCTLVH